MKRVLIILVASLALCVGRADAQRYLPKMQGIELKAGMTDGFYSHASRAETGYYFGVALSTYTKGGNRWVFGGEYLQRYSLIRSIVYRRRNSRQRVGFITTSSPMRERSSLSISAVLHLLDMKR